MSTKVDNQEKRPGFPIRVLLKRHKMLLKDIDELFAADLRDPAYAAGYLTVALEEDGIEGFLYALQKVVRAQKMNSEGEAT